MYRESFIFYRSFLEAISDLADAERLTLYDAICRYALEGELFELSGITKMLFTLIKPQLDANNRRYTNGQKGGRPKETNDDEGE